MHKDKKGQFDLARKSVYWMIAGVMLTISILIFAMVMSTYKSNQSATPEELQAHILALRFTQAPECFAYQDSLTGRVLLGTIDAAKLTKARLHSCYQTSSTIKGLKDFNFGISVKGFNPRASDGSESLLMMPNFILNRVKFEIEKDVLVKSGDSVSVTKMKFLVSR